MVVILTDTPSWGTRTIGAYRVASALRRHGVEVEVIDFISQWPFMQLMGYLYCIKNVEWWGLSTPFRFDQILLRDENCGKLTQMDAKREKYLFEFLRNRGQPVVLGGPNVENALLGMGELEVDYALIGYADLGVIKLHDHITHGSELKYSTHNGVKVTNCNTHYGDIDLGAIETVVTEHDFFTQGDVFPVEISRGCIFHCAFCSFSHLGKRPGTYIRPKEDIKREIVERYENYKATQFLFLDDTFNDSVEKMQMIKEIRQESGIPFEFWSYARLDLLAANRQMFDLVGDCGWKAMTIGIETLNKTAGKSIGKGADPLRLRHCLRELKNSYPDLHIQANIIIGLPHDSEQSVRETVDWFMENSELINALRVNVLRIDNPDLRSFASKISREPEKYGYTVLAKGPLAVNWQTHHLNRQAAKELKDQLQPKIDSRLGSYRHWADLLDIERNGDGFDETGFPLEIARIDHYIHSKRQARGL